MAETHGETAFPGRLTGRGKPILEACAWKDGNLEIRINDEARPWEWINLEVNLGELIQWYRRCRILLEEENASSVLSEFKADDNPPDELGAR